MNTGALKKFAQVARRQLREQVAGRLEQVLRTDGTELREKESALRELREQIAQTSKKAVIDRVAYTWFNRFCALRFMDVNRYTRMGVVSPAEGLSQPEILQEAKRGYIDDDLKGCMDAQGIFDLLNGQRPSADPQQEAYRLLLVGVCNSYNAAMPFLFEKIADYTELLMPLDLLSEHAVLHDLRQALTPEACQDVEVIGWLYQYYISERKDEVFEALKQNQKIEAGDIPAATQLFTPHWIVRYLVENSLGRLWMLNHPDSKLVDQMEYYIKPAQEETDFLKVSSPEDIRLNDPACGSGHMLTYAFDLLYAMYEEAGYPAADIPRLILEKNLYGLEIDPRAGALAAFALTMKARLKDRRFLSHGVQPNICVLENVTFTPQELDEYMRAVGRDLFTAPLLETLKQFEQADNFGSLIRPALTDVAFVRQTLEARNLGGDLFLYDVHRRVLKVLKQAEFLAPRYHVVVANPPYMGSGGMNSELKDFANAYYEDSKADAYTMFIVKNTEMSLKKGFIGMITIPNWMFLSSFENLRNQLLSKSYFSSFIHNGRGVWGSDFGSCAFVIANQESTTAIGYFKRLYSKQGEVNSNSILQSRFFDNKKFPFYRVSPEQFFKIPGSPIAYWVSDNLRDIFEKSKPLSQVMTPRKGIATGNNEKFLRLWHEVEKQKTAFPKNVGAQNMKWYATTKGGDFRKWYGNHEHLVNWENDGYEIKNYRNPDGSLKSRPQNTDFFFRGGITWSDITISQNAFREFPEGFAFEGRGPAGFFKDKRFFKPVLAFLNSKVATYSIQSINSTVSLNVGEISKLPFLKKIADVANLPDIVSKSILISQRDWDTYESSWDFKTSPLLEDAHCLRHLKDAVSLLFEKFHKTTLEMQQLEKENNRIIIDLYELKDELNPDVALNEITLTCNPYYRYGVKKSEEELEALLKADTIKEFISYAVGCMFGRYALDKPGLVLANQGETLQDYLRQVPEPSFLPDEDNAIPVLEGEWFSDDMPSRFKQFLRLTFGDEHYAENLAFIEEAIGRDIRSYFVKEFYKDHVQMYKKRPIYWMFSSPKGSFNVLMYMHRYKPDTISIILNNYLRQYREKLNAHRAYQEAIDRNPGVSQGERTKALREIDWVNKILAELKEYEDEILYPLAAQQIKIDLDDGVKVNYGKFGAALKPISGL